MGSTLKIGIAGGRGLSTLMGFKSIEGVEVAALCDLDEDLLQIGVKFTYGESAAYDNDPLDICRSIVDRYDGRLAVIDLKGAIQIVASLHI